MYDLEIGQGQVIHEADGVTLHLPPVDQRAYHDAQISSYTRDYTFAQQAPLRLSLRAWRSGTIHGTAGFGFWNHPFAPGEIAARLPKAAWFFYGSPPNDMALAKGVPGYGWKCATIDAANWRFLSLLPAAPLGFLLMRVPALYNALWPVGQRALKVSEHWLGPAIPESAHDYTLDWLPDRVIFRVDGVIVHEAATAPRGKLGFVAWVDNQYAVVTPQGRFRFGLLDVPGAVSLHIEDMSITML